MKIIRIILNGFKKFTLSKHGNIELTFDNKLVLIIGTNGVGKSSLVKELSPLPANHTDFSKGGFKQIEIEYNNSYYILLNSFDGSMPKYSFIKDNTELNPGHTVTVYKDLVFKFFNLDTNSFNLLNNDNSFIDYNNQDRKNWITRISDNDLTYAISFYNKNKEILRDIQGGLKLSKTKLLQESDKLVNKSEHERLKLIINDSKILIDSLLNLRDNTHIDPIELKNTIHIIEEKISSHSDSLLNTSSKYPRDIKYATIESLDTENINTQASINTLVVHIDNTQQQLKQLSQKLDLLKKANIDSKEVTMSKLLQVSDDIVDLNKQLHYPMVLSNPEDTLTSYLTIYENLQDLFMNLVSNEDKVLNKDYYISKLETYNQLTNRIITLESTERAYTAKKLDLEARRRDNGVECPKCSHQWFIGYTEKDYLVTVESLNKLTADINTAKVTHNTSKEELEKIKFYLDCFDTYRNITNKWTILSPIWNIINNDELLYKDPKALIVKLELIKEDILLHIKTKKFLADKKQLEQVLDLLDKDNQLSLDSLTTDHDKYNKELYESTKELNRLREHLNYIKQLKITLTNINASRTYVEGLLSDYSLNMGKALTFKKKHAIDDIIRTVKLYTSDKENMLSKQTIQVSIVDNIQKTINEQEELLIYHKAIEKSLSPTEGLIAKSLTGFINLFVLQVNSFIKKIWSYPLELVTITPDENLDINYKFKVLVNDNITIPDISKLSSAQKEIVDLAIRIVSMKYLKITDFPLYLDEFAAKMDIVHRKAAFYTISNLLLNSNFSQIFLINHYEDQYGSLKNAQIVDLNTL